MKIEEKQNNVEDEHNSTLSLKPIRKEEIDETFKKENAPAEL